MGFMTDDEVAERLRAVTTKLAAPVINSGASDDILKTVWRAGYLPARAMILEEGATKSQVDKAMEAFKLLADIDEPGDFVAMPGELFEAIRADYFAELAIEPALKIQRLDERIIAEIGEFRVEMYGNESKHAGRPHVKVHLQDGAISVSLDDPPENLTPRGGMRGERSALKVIAKHRDELIILWHETRPDTQRLNPRN